MVAFTDELNYTRLKKH